MNPFTVVVGTDQLELPLQLRDGLRARGVSCAVLVEGGHSGAATAVPASAALAAAGISAVIVIGPAAAPALLADFRGALPRVLTAQPSAEATIGDLQARGWIAAPGEAYTEEELATVTARLQELGYA